MTNSILGTEEKPMRDRAGLPYLLDGSSHATQRAGRPLDLQDTWCHGLSPPQREHRKSPAAPWSLWALPTHQF